MGQGLHGQSGIYGPGICAGPGLCEGSAATDKHDNESNIDYACKGCAPMSCSACHACTETGLYDCGSLTTPRLVEQQRCSNGPGGYGLGPCFTARTPRTPAPLAGDLGPGLFDGAPVCCHAEYCGCLVPGFSALPLKKGSSEPPVSLLPSKAVVNIQPAANAESIVLTSTLFTPRGLCDDFRPSVYIRQESRVGPRPEQSESEIGLVHRRPHQFTTGAIYSGQWLGTMRHGIGRMKWPDGTFYAGMWVEDEADGLGIFKQHESGNRYTGEFKKGAAQGHGVLFWDETSYQGQFLRNVPHGAGKESWVDTASYAGFYYNGRRNGSGIHTWADGASYRGEWKAGVIVGLGRYQGGGRDGCSYDGTWRESVKHGIGQYRFPDGRVYRGQYLKDKKHGFGIFTWQDGRSYTGCWACGFQEGRGILQLLDKSEHAFQWRRGKRVVRQEGEGLTKNDSDRDVMLLPSLLQKTGLSSPPGRKLTATTPASPAALGHVSEKAQEKAA